MGAWGTGIFESDGALDFVLELTDTADLELVQQALDEVREASDDYMDVDIAERGLVSAEVVAALTGSPGDLPDDLTDWLAGQTLDPTITTKQAHQAVRMIRDDSELRELWEESDDFDGWLLGINDLLERLSE